MKITDRKYYQAGNEAKVYAIDFPENDPDVSLHESDLRVRWQLVDGELVPEIGAYRAGEWVRINDWHSIFSKPPLAPSPHDLDGEHHAGKLPISKVSGHTRNNPVHVQIRMEAVLMGQSGAARASSTMI